MLAELIESNGELSKVVTGLDNRMADVQQKVTNLCENKDQAKVPDSEKIEEPWIPLATHETSMRSVIQELHAKEEENKSLKARLDKAIELNRLTAGSQHAKHFMRWAFMKRHHLWWYYVTIINLLFAVLLFNLVNLHKENARLTDNDWKWRYVAAQGFAQPEWVQALDETFNHNDERQIDKVKRFVLNHEESLRQMSDSIVRAEREKLQRMVK